MSLTLRAKKKKKNGRNNEKTKTRKIVKKES